MWSSQSLTQWVVYDHPSDYPRFWVARRFQISDDHVQATQHVYLGDTLDEVRNLIQRSHPGLVMLPRWLDDDPNIYEVWT